MEGTQQRLSTACRGNVWSSTPSFQSSHFLAPHTCLQFQNSEVWWVHSKAVRSGAVTIDSLLRPLALPELSSLVGLLSEEGVCTPYTTGQNGISSLPFMPSAQSSL